MIELVYMILMIRCVVVVMSALTGRTTVAKGCGSAMTEIGRRRSCEKQEEVSGETPRVMTGVLLL